MKKFQIRQGDVFLEKIESLPNGLKPVKQKKKKIILAYGEATGHHHAIEEIEKVDSFIDADGNLYLDIKEDTVLTHQEHSEIKLPVGVYVVTTQREYSPEEIRNVRD